MNLASRLDLLTLKLFVATVEQQSIAKAAEREHIAPSAVSKRIADLELATQSQLLYRHRKGIEPTPAGEALLNHARVILRNLKNLESEISDFAEGIRGSVRIAASESALFGYFPHALRSFTELHPHVRIDLSSQTSAAAVQAVATCACDIGIFWGDEPTGALRVSPCYVDRLLVVAPLDHPLASVGSLKYLDVLEHELIEQEPGSAIQTLLAKHANAHGAVMRSRIRVAGYDAVCRMVEAGLGIGIVPSSYAASRCASSQVKTIPLDETWVDRTYKICFGQDEHQASATRLLLDFLLSLKPNFDVASVDDRINGIRP